MDSYIELSRTFRSIRIPDGDSDLSALISKNWLYGRRGPQWTWDQLLQKYRVVVLAEADSGKTWEFKAQADRLNEQGKDAFFFPIELLAKESIENFLKPEDVVRFREWKKSEKPAYFFLDSVDEANINHLSFEFAVRKLGKELNGRLQRSRLYFSSRPHPRDCRRDGATIEDWLKPPEPTENPSETEDFSASDNDPFVTKIFNPQKEVTRDTTKFDVEYACLSPLDRLQQETYVREFVENEVDDFFRDLRLFGIEFFTERPGDLKLLLLHWKQFGTFDRKEKMCQKAIEEKLAEGDDKAPLSDRKALDGAMEIAAALTFAKAYSFSASIATELDSDQKTLSIRSVLAEWPPGERTSLLSRGIFVPSGYGALKFHHRQTQEYLCAKWIDRLLKHSDCQKRTINDLVFKEVDGVEVVVPSLKPVVAWLALWQPFVREKILEVDPFIFLTLGDPSSLPISVRRKSLERYASMRVSGELASNELRYQTIHQFAAPELADAITKIWQSTDDDFLKTELLVLVANGRISDCVDIAFTVAKDEKNHASLRGLAIEALEECSAEKELRTLATQLVGEIPPLEIDDFLWMAKSIFPEYVTAQDVCNAIENARQRDSDRGTGLEIALSEVVNNWPEQDLVLLATTIGNLFFKQPHKGYRSDYSAQFDYLSLIIPTLACRITESKTVANDEHNVLQMLAASERCEMTGDQRKTLDSMLDDNRCLKIHLFWHDVDLARERSDKDEITNVAQVMPEAPLWFFAEADLDLLLKELVGRENLDDRKLILNAIFQTFRSSERRAELGVEELISDSPKLVEAWAAYQERTVPSDQEIARVERRRKRELKKKEEKERSKQSWLVFKDELLSEPERMLSAGEGQSFKLRNIKRWLELSTSKWCNNIEDPRKLLCEVTNETVADCFVAASGTHWRSIDPVQHNSESELAFTSIFIDSKYAPGWAEKLTSKECILAVKIALTNGHSFPDWLSQILMTRLEEIRDLVSKQIAIEWISDTPSQFFLCRFCDPRFPISKTITNMLVSTFCKTKPTSVDRLINAIKILRQANLTDNQRVKISAYAVDNLSSSDLNFRINYLAILIIVDEDECVKRLKQWLDSEPAPKAVEIAERFFGGYFEWHSGSLLKDILPGAKASTIEQLVHLCYGYVRVSDDIAFEGSTSSLRSNAQHSRSVLIQSLANPADSDRLSALKELSRRSEYQPEHPWIKMIARQAAETMAESEPWTLDVFRRFNNDFSFEIRNAKQLYVTVLNILEDIRYDFDNADSSSKRLLRTLGRHVPQSSNATVGQQKKVVRADEASVQEWLAEQLRLRSRGLFTVIREPQVSGNKRPDLTASIATCEIAIEVKQADSWSIAELKKAVSDQLAGQYLKVQERRYGILFALNHRPKKWRPGKTGKHLPFQQVLSLMGAEAERVNAENAGSIEVSVFGLSVAAPATHKQKK